MPTVAQREIEQLVAGDKLTWEEFERRWNAMPNLKRAELIDGVVYMPSPLSNPHAIAQHWLTAWLASYELRTPGCAGATEATVRMQGDAPQPDALLRLHEDVGGASRIEGNYVAGPIELAAEICHSSSAYDLNQKKDLYLRAGVKEYLAILIREQEVHWMRNDRRKQYKDLKPVNRVLRSVVFPGLWLDWRAFLEGRYKRVIEILEEGTSSPEHTEFVQRLTKRRPAK